MSEMSAGNAHCRQHAEVEIIILNMARASQFALCTLPGSTGHVKPVLCLTDGRGLFAHVSFAESCLPVMLPHSMASRYLWRHGESRRAACA